MCTRVSSLFIARDVKRAVYLKGDEVGGGSQCQSSVARAGKEGGGGGESSGRKRALAWDSASSDMVARVARELLRCGCDLAPVRWPNQQRRLSRRQIDASPRVAHLLRFKDHSLTHSLTH